VTIAKRLRDRARRLKTDVPALYIALRKRETPVLAKILACAAVVYALSPVDLIPDFIPVLGWLDDLLLLPGLVALSVRLMDPRVFDECRREAEGIWKAERPKKWAYALPVIAVWLIALIWVLRTVLV
jgi:uncharacterized membrane protein YkvA (DUF1232 family)